jgi:hypothetical protein
MVMEKMEGTNAARRKSPPVAGKRGNLCGKACGVIKNL